MLAEKVMIHTSRRIIKVYEETLDGRAALVDLAFQARQSTEAVVAGRRTLEKIAHQRYDSRAGSALSFITKFEEVMESYNLQQRNPGMMLTGPMMKAYLQTALSSVVMLRAVSDRENDRIIRGEPEFTYDEYLRAVKASATIYDENTGGKRSVNVAQATNSDPDPLVEEMTEYFVNMAKKRAPGATMSKETWQNISDEGKSVWDKLSNSDKQKILQYAMKRATAKETITVNQAVIQASEDDTEEFEDAKSPPDTENAQDNPELEINQAVSKARSEAHPGDVRRVLSGPTKKRATTQVKFAQWITKDDIEDEGSDGADQLIEDEYDWEPGGDQDFQ
jgi:hypothetical protein